jgi:hypothetical protein
MLSNSPRPHWILRPVGSVPPLSRISREHGFITSSTTKGQPPILHDACTFSDLLKQSVQAPKRSLSFEPPLQIGETTHPYDSSEPYFSFRVRLPRSLSQPCQQGRRDIVHMCPVGSSAHGNRSRCFYQGAHDHQRRPKKRDVRMEGLSKALPYHTICMFIRVVGRSVVASRLLSASFEPMSSIGLGTEDDRVGLHLLVTREDSRAATKSAVRRLTRGCLEQLKAPEY